jgi:dihydrofolate synthase/folylpolyglutamate synthase
MTREPVLQYLYGLQLFGMKAGLRNISELLDATGHPERAYPTIHIAGTNGKGSVSSLIAAVLTAAGYKTGLYTSPHLVHFTERIRVNGAVIPREAIIDYMRTLKPVIQKTKATFFEATTAIAFNYFRDAGVDIAVIETGLGGRLDATNVVRPLVSIITNIGLDHTEHLGTTLRAIAKEKGGIIKSGVPVLTGVRDAVILKELRRLARSKKSVLLEAQRLVRCEIRNRSLEGITLSLETDRWELRDLKVSLAGDHQAVNIQVAVAALQLLPSPYQRQLGCEKFRLGFSSVRKLTGLRGRLEVLQSQPPVILDVAHNPQGIAASTDSLRRILPGKWLIVFGVMKDKDYRGMLQVLCKHSRMIIGVRPDTPRALRSHEIIKFLHANRSKGTDGHSVENGMRIALNERRIGEPLVITGSHYVAGEVLKFLNIPV